MSAHQSSRQLFLDPRFFPECGCPQLEGIKAPVMPRVAGGKTTDHPREVLTGRSRAGIHRDAGRRASVPLPGFPCIRSRCQ